MHKVMVCGAGKIGALIACLLSQSNDYEVLVTDVKFDGSDIKRLMDKHENIKTMTLDVSDSKALAITLSQNEIDAVISSLPYFVNLPVATAAKEANVHYFDLTEDVAVTNAVKELAIDSEKAFVPQCGLAPGFISILANSLMQSFDEIDIAKLRVGALPQNTSNALHYALTWSTDGVINEYCNPCHAVMKHEDVEVEALEDLETIRFDGETYEAFNTSGGLGSLATLYQGKVNAMNYKTMRYPGHCEKMKFLLHDLKFKSHQDELKTILERAIPKTYQDVVVVYVSVSGHKKGVYEEANYLKKVYPQEISGINWSAIQVTTASGICTVVDMVLSDESNYHGLVLQEAFPLETFLENRFGYYYA